MTWWRHQMEPFSALLALRTGNSPVSGEFPAQRPVTRSFDVCFDLHLIKRLGKHSQGWWFETLSRPLWRHCNKTKAITWASVDPDLCDHMASLGNNESRPNQNGNFFQIHFLEWKLFYFDLHFTPVWSIRFKWLLLHVIYWSSVNMTLLEPMLTVNLTQISNAI